MATQASGQVTAKPLIETDRVEGTTVHDPSGNSIGTIRPLMIDKISGRVAYAVMSFGGFLGNRKRRSRRSSNRPCDGDENASPNEAGN